MGSVEELGPGISKHHAPLNWGHVMSRFTYAIRRVFGGASSLMGNATNQETATLNLQIIINICAVGNKEYGVQNSFLPIIRSVPIKNSNLICPLRHTRKALRTTESSISIKHP